MPPARNTDDTFVETLRDSFRGKIRLKVEYWFSRATLKKKTVWSVFEREDQSSIL